MKPTLILRDVSLPVLCEAIDASSEFRTMSPPRAGAASCAGARPYS